MDFSNLLSTTANVKNQRNLNINDEEIIEEKKDEKDKTSTKEIYDETNDDEIHLKKNSYPTLILKVIDAKYLNRNTKLLITPSSVNKRQFNDGDSFYFGKNDEENAFNFPLEENIGDRQFQIKYDLNLKTYVISDCRRGTGLFVKTDRLTLENDSIFSFCNTHMLVYRMQNNRDKTLKIKFLHGVLKEKTFTFKPNETKRVRVGRNKNLEIVCDEENVSRIQCTFVFDKTWCIYDGTPEKQSRNGIWLLASKGIPIVNNMLIKSGNTTLQASLSY